MKYFPGLLLASLVASLTHGSDPIEGLRLPAIFGDHMVLQRDQTIRVWGWDNPGQTIAVLIAPDQRGADGQVREGKAGADGRWDVELPAMKAGGPYRMQVRGSVTRNFKDVLIGEVWICSGQSNMAWPVKNSNHAELEIPAANFPNIRLISVPQVGTQEPQDDFKGQWARCSPETTTDFSGVGYFFGRQLHQTLNVPIGLIDNAWGGSACEAWVDRGLLKEDGRFDELLTRWQQEEANLPQAMAKHEERMKVWREKVKKARAAGKRPQGRAPRSPESRMKGQHRPGNLYNGVLKPTIGYGIRGAIWYQGESNASRAYQYRDLFPLMIQSWRNDWKQGDFPFYWVQLADFRGETDAPQESDWAELREAQTMTMSKLKNTGEAVIIDVGEGRDIHPRNKQAVGMRLARWALARDYGKDITYKSPTYKSMEIDGNKVTLTFDHVGQTLYTFDVREPVGFTIAGADKRFHNAKAQLNGRNQVVVWSDDVTEPVAVRYAWADNPIANLYSREGLPATPFRTDKWPGKTANNR